MRLMCAEFPPQASRRNWQHGGFKYYLCKVTGRRPLFKIRQVVEG